MAERAEPSIRADLLKALRHLRTAVPIDDVIDKLKGGGRAADIVGAIPLAHYRQVLNDAMRGIGDLYLRAAEHGADHLKKQTKGRRALHYQAPHRRVSIYRFGKDIGDGFEFDRFDDSTQRRLRQQLDRLIKDLSDQSLDTIRESVVGGLRAGDDFASIAANIRDTISLTPNQAQAVANYRRLLENLDSGALQRALRDTDLDSLVREAIASGNPLSAAQVDDAVGTYLENYLDHRADTIASTESLRAANTGLREGYQQAVERGAMPAEAVRRQWLIAADENVCPICLSIVENNPDGVGLDEEFRSDGGTVSDPPVHPKCRCTVQYETDVDMIA